jgi:hypothetical protein
MSQKRNFAFSLDDEVHTIPKKSKCGISLPVDEVHRNSQLKRKSTTENLPKEEDPELGSRATKRQRNSSGLSPLRRTKGHPSGPETADRANSQSRESEPLPDDESDTSIKYGILSLTEANLSLISFNDSTPSEMSQSFISQSDRSGVVKSTDPEYETLLKERGIYSLSRKAPEPNNLAEIKQALAATRKSPGPDNNTAENFPRRVSKSGNEGGAMQALLPKVLPIIECLWDTENDALPVNQQWDRQTLLKPELRLVISPPKPDQAFGFIPDAFPFPQAALFLKPSMSPARDLAWPYFTVEAKGRQGHFDIARLQNSHNAAIMLNNMIQLPRALDKEHDFLGGIQVMTMELTTESISLRGYFAIKNASGALEFHSICLSCVSA